MGSKIYTLINEIHTLFKFLNIILSSTIFHFQKLKN